MSQSKFLVVKTEAQNLILEEEHIHAKIEMDRAKQVISESSGAAEIYTAQNLCLRYNDTTITGDEMFLLITN